MFSIGLTGSIGMGKSTTADMFRDEGIAVWDADGAVHRLYSQGGAGVTAIGELFPQAIRDGAVSRDRLKAVIASDDTALLRIENAIHPLVRQDRALFLDKVQGDIVVFDIPLLFETGDPDEFDIVAVVSVDRQTQKDRVMERGTMTSKQFKSINERQMPDVEKCARADVVIPTLNLEETRAKVRSLIDSIRRGTYARDRS